MRWCELVAVRWHRQRCRIVLHEVQDWGGGDDEGRGLGARTNDGHARRAARIRGGGEMPVHRLGLEDAGQKRGLLPVSLQAAAPQNFPQVADL